MNLKDNILTKLNRIEPFCIPYIIVNKKQVLVDTNLTHQMIFKGEYKDTNLLITEGPPLVMSTFYNVDTSKYPEGRLTGPAILPEYKGQSGIWCTIKLPKFQIPEGYVRDTSKQVKFTVNICTNGLRKSAMWSIIGVTDTMMNVQLGTFNNQEIIDHLQYNQNINNIVPEKIRFGFDCDGNVSGAGLMIYHLYTIYPCKQITYTDA